MHRGSGPSYNSSVHKFLDIDIKNSLLWTAIWTGPWPPKHVLTGLHIKLSFVCARATNATKVNICGQQCYQGQAYIKNLHRDTKALSPTLPHISMYERTLPKQRSPVGCECSWLSASGFHSGCTAPDRTWDPASIEGCLHVDIRLQYRAEVVFAGLGNIHSVRHSELPMMTGHHNMHETGHALSDVKQAGGRVLSGARWSCEYARIAVALSATRIHHG